MNAKATVVAIAIKIVMVNAVVKKGEKVFNAYIMVSIRFELLLLLVGLARLGCSLSALLLSIVTNGVIASSRCVCTIGAKKKGVKFFFKFFFAWVWGRGCGGVGVGAWVWGRGCGGVGREVGAAGWRWAGAG